MPEQTTVAEPEPKQKSVSVRLDGANDSVLRIVVRHRKKDACFQTRVTHVVPTGKTNEKGKPVRTTSHGATQKHETFEEAEKVFNALVKKATAKGWKIHVRKGGGFVARPDSFDAKTLPGPKTKVVVKAEA